MSLLYLGKKKTQKRWFHSRVDPVCESLLFLSIHELERANVILLDEVLYYGPEYIFRF